MLMLIPPAPAATHSVAAAPIVEDDEEEEVLAQSPCTLLLLSRRIGSVGGNTTAPVLFPLPLPLSSQSSPMPAPAGGGPRGDATVITAPDLVTALVVGSTIPPPLLAVSAPVVLLASIIAVAIDPAGAV
jgi:hypothetical protein